MIAPVVEVVVVRQQAMVVDRMGIARQMILLMQKTGIDEVQAQEDENAVGCDRNGVPCA
jgi:hypothetical protein